MSETTAPAAGTTGTAPTAGTAGTARRGRAARVALRALQIVLALFYAFASALPKLIAHPSAVESFDTLGWGSAGMYTIGALELAGAIGLLVPALAPVAAVSLGALMVGAFITQITAFEGEYAATPLILIIPLTLIAWTRRQDVTGPAQWLRRPRRDV
ncbi:DoxX family protein [Streptomyces sp. NPDC057438]|uniref:DoxX family protein n=1 Tax=Streptomyces sp. NPDC057438 TaxID=3346133 RepID=UPI0036C220A6